MMYNANEIKESDYDELMQYINNMEHTISADDNISNDAYWKSVGNETMFGKQHPYKYVCSKCDSFAPDYGNFMTEYCPHCGSKMNKEYQTPNKNLEYDFTAQEDVYLNNNEHVRVFYRWNNIKEKFLDYKTKTIFVRPYAEITEEPIEIEKEKSIRDVSKFDDSFIYVWGWPGPDWTEYRFEDFGITWGFSKKDFERYKGNNEQ